jgi:hypothetical protein
MRTLTESREEFNPTMNPYTAIIVQTEHFRFSDEFFIQNGLICPKDRIKYTPPSWVGAENSPYFMASCKRPEKPIKTREERIPEINSKERYLICDDYSNDGETFEIAIIRLMEAGVKLENIWGITQEGNKEHKGIVLNKGIDWHEYRLKREGITRLVLENLGFTYPSFPAKNL